MSDNRVNTLNWATTPTQTDFISDHFTLDKAYNIFVSKLKV